MCIVVVQNPRCLWNINDKNAEQRSQTQITVNGNKLDATNTSKETKPEKTLLIFLNHTY